MSRTTLLVAVLLVITFLLPAVFFNSLPEKIATHWGLQGNPDAFSEKSIGVFGVPLLSLFIALLFLVIPKIDPKKENFSAFRSEYDLLWVLLHAFLLYLLILMIVFNLGTVFSMTAALFPALAALFFFISRLLQKAKPNWFVGIRTPWALSSETVWNDTHQIGAKLFRGLAVLCILGIFLPPEFLLAIIALVIASAIALIVYSFVRYRREKKP